MQDQEHQVPSTGMSNAEALAKAFHTAYEELAPQFKYETRKKSAVPWDELKGKNRKLMVATAQKLIDDGVILVLPQDDSGNDTTDKEQFGLDWAKPGSIKETADRLQAEIDNRHKTASGLTEINDKENN